MNIYEYVYRTKSEARCQSLRIALCSLIKKNENYSQRSMYEIVNNENVMAMEILNVQIQKAST